MENINLDPAQYDNMKLYFNLSMGYYLFDGIYRLCVLFSNQNQWGIEIALFISFTLTGVAGTLYIKGPQKEFLMACFIGVVTSVVFYSIQISQLYYVAVFLVIVTYIQFCMDVFCLLYMNKKEHSNGNSPLKQEANPNGAQPNYSPAPTQAPSYTPPPQNNGNYYPNQQPYQPQPYQPQGYQPNYN